jgi:hypothetical protein
MKEVELVGGPRDGDRVRLFESVRQLDHQAQIRPAHSGLFIRTPALWVKTGHYRERDAETFEWEQGE